MATCAHGWELVSHPDTPDGYKLSLPDRQNFWGTWYFDRERLGEYAWEAAVGVLPTQGNCGQPINLTVGFSYETSSAHSIDIGTLFNVPGLGEAFEISGGYTYTWGSGSGTATGGEVQVGERNYEFMVTPLVLAFRLGERYSYRATTVNLSVGNIIHTLRGGTFQPFTDYDRTVTDWEPPLYVRGGLMICRRQCTPTSRAPLEEERRHE